jgi:hypothetical protein
MEEMLIDPAGTPLQHGRQHPLRDDHDAPQVHPHDPVPVLVGDVQEGRHAGDAGVVDEDVDRAEVLLDLGDRPVGRGAVGHVQAGA